jgi:DNA-binding LacI/PurR family transcriptional regulator
MSLIAEEKRVTTIYDVAKQAGVSIGTVSRYVNSSGYVGKAARERIASAIRDLDFRPSGVARSLTTKRTFMLGFVVSDLMNPFVPEVARGIQDFADERGYCVLILNTDGDEAREVRALKVLRERQVDGVIITPPETATGNDYIRELHTDNVPVVLLGRQVEEADIDRVTTDTYAGGRAAMQHLLALGHRRIAYIGGALARHVAPSRRRAYFDALDAVGIAVDPALIAEATLDHDGGHSAMDSLLGSLDPPTAVFTVNDVIALGALEAAHQHGLLVPRDMSVVGFDDIFLARQSRPPLTTVAQPKRALGHTAAELLVERLERTGTAAHREIRLPCELVERMTTAVPRAART